MNRFIGSREIELKEWKPQIEIPPELVRKGERNMALFDKLKETANSVKDKASSFAEEKQLTEKLGNAKDSVKRTLDESTSSFKEYQKENKELKQALEGALARYEVTYVGGLPQYPKVKMGSASIGLNIMENQFAFRKTGNSKDWFNDFDIPYDSVLDLHIEKRTITTAEVFLGAGNDANQEQENVICIIFKADTGEELTLRVEMLTGFTIYRQAEKCREFIALLRQHGILQRLEQKKDADSSGGNGGSDILSQIEKLASLRDAGILTDEEFQDKKKALLSKI